MTRLEEAVWAAAYVSTMEQAARQRPRTRGDMHILAVGEADAIVMAMRRGIGYCDGQLHTEVSLELERKEAP